MRRADVKLMVNWPTNWRPIVRHAMDLARQGAIGDLYGTHYRGAHDGPIDFGCSPQFSEWLFDPSRGGGALTDYCCYGAAFAAYLLGRPTRVTALAGRLYHDYQPCEDNAVITMLYHNALAVTEGSWNQIGVLGNTYTLVIRGTEGTLEAGRQRLLMTTRDNPEPREVEAPPLPPGEDNAADYFCSRILRDEPIEGLVDPIVGRNAQEILAAGKIAATRGRAVSLPLGP